MYDLIYADISSVTCEVMVNASNGRGYMGGKSCAVSFKRGVAESMQFATHGLIEVEAKKVVRSFGIKIYLFGLSASSFFVTSSCGLPCKVVFHAVTMRNPASRSSIKIIYNCLVSLKEYCLANGYTDIALPMLGCGNGGVLKEDFLKSVNMVFPETLWKIKIVDK